MASEKNIKELDYDEYLRISAGRFRLAKELFKQKFILGKNPASSDTQDNLVIYEALSDMYDDNIELLRQVFEVADDYKEIGNLYNKVSDDLELYKKALEKACYQFITFCDGCEDRSLKLTDEIIKQEMSEYKEYLLNQAKEELPNENI